MADADHVALAETERESDAGIGAVPVVGVGAESASRTQREPEHSEGHSVSHNTGMGEKRALHQRVACMLPRMLNMNTQYPTPARDTH